MDYEVYVDGVKINSTIKAIQISDRQGAQADDIRLLILNDENLHIQRGSVLACSFGGFSSGNMNVDTISGNSQTTHIGAKSSPLNAKKKNTRHWLKVRLFDIVNDVATNNGLSVYYQGVENYYYENVTQFNETDLAFLNRICQREGYCLKIDDNRLVVYSRSAIESAGVVMTIDFDTPIDHKIAFSENPNKITSVTVRHYSDGLKTYTATRGVGGEEVTIKEYAFDSAEAERFAKGYLSTYAQDDTTMDCLIAINDGIAAGCCVEVKDYAMYDGKYVVFECCHDPENNQTRLRGRKV
jgi:phage protein D